MIAYAKARFMRVSPVKVRQVIDLIRGKDVHTSLAILTNVSKGSTGMINKVLVSAISNAKQKGLSEDQLFISKILAEQGASWRRYRPAAFGRATPILKRTTHLTIELDLITK
jgi:large subunit ribosomal protein L22